MSFHSDVKKRSSVIIPLVCHGDDTLHQKSGVGARSRLVVGDEAGDNDLAGCIASDPSVVGIHGLGQNSVAARGLVTRFLDVLCPRKHVHAQHSTSPGGIMPGMIAAIG